MADLQDSARTVVRTLKEDGVRRTYLLEDRSEPGRRFVCKQASGPDAELLRKEHAVLLALPAPLRFETLELQETPDGCRLLRDYIPGATLAALVDGQGIFTPREAAELGIKLCRALAPLHALTPPVIHRDLKPENVLLTELGRVRLIDFGAARTYKPGHEEDTVLLGTKGYAAPEQYGFGQTDVRTDIFALGKLLGFVLAGEYTDVPPRLTGRDKSLERIIRRCCAYDPARRYQHVQALENALSRFLARRAFPVCDMVLAVCAALALCTAALWGGYTLGRRVPASLPEAETSGWDPFRWEPDVTDILRLAEEQDWPALAGACEKMVTALTEDPLIRATEPVAFWTLDEQALSDYYLSRQGYEFIADNLAYGDSLAAARLGTYEAAMPVFALHLRSHIDYVVTDDAGSTQSSALHMLVVDGDDRNIDGCVIEILGALDRALEQTPVP